MACWQFALAIALRERDEVRAEREAAQVEAGVSKLAMEDMVRHMVQREAFDQERRRAVTAEAERDALAARADKVEQSVALARHALDARYGSQHEPGCELRRGVGDGCTCHSDRDIAIQRLDVAEDDRATAEARATAAEVRAEKAEAERDEARALLGKATRFDLSPYGIDGDFVERVPGNRWMAWVNGDARGHGGHLSLVGYAARDEAVAAVEAWRKATETAE